MTDRSILSLWSFKSYLNNIFPFGCVCECVGVTCTWRPEVEAESPLEWLPSYSLRQTLSAKPRADRWNSSYRGNLVGQRIKHYYTGTLIFHTKRSLIKQEIKETGWLTLKGAETAAIISARVFKGGNEEVYARVNWEALVEWVGVCSQIRTADS